MIYDEASPASVMKVLSSWETARQRNGFDEQLGIDTLLILFKMNPEIKPIYGFAVDREVKAQGIQRMGILIHGLQVVSTFDAILSALGPDEELLSEVIAETGEKHCQRGLSPDHFTLLCRSLLQVLEKIMGDKWTADIQAAWSQIIHCVSAEITKNMQKRTKETCQTCHIAGVSNLQRMDLAPLRPSPRAA